MAHEFSQHQTIRALTSSGLAIREVDVIPPAVPAASFDTVTANCPGALPGMFVLPSATTLSGDVAVTGVTISAVDTLTVQFYNPTAAPITPDPYTFAVLLIPDAI